MTDATVRIATHDDIAEVLRLESDRRSTGVSWVMGDAQVRSRIDDHRVLLAECEGRIVGYLSYFWMGPAPWLEFVWLVEPERGRGLGRALVEALETELRSMGCTLLMSTTTIGEESPRLWHRALGFRECGIIVFDPADPGGDIVLRKEIQ